MTRIFVGLLLATLATASAAQDASKRACVAADLPAGLAAWKDRASLAGPSLTVSRAATVALRPVAEVRYAAVPERPGTAGSFGAALTVEIAKAGIYRVALSEAAWIDMVAAGTTIPSIAHGHGPACTSIRKIVAFPLKPGRHILQLGGSAKESVAVLVTSAD